MVECSVAYILDSGGLRRTWLRDGRMSKAVPIHIAGFNNLGLLVSGLLELGTPKGTADAQQGVLFVIQADGACALIAAAIMQPALFVVAIPPSIMGSTS
jgi:hypothetical protein